MKIKFYTCLAAIAVMLLCCAPVYADLTIIGTAEGTPEYWPGTYNLVYEDDSPGGGLVWLDFVTYDTRNWNYQVNWAAGLGEKLTITLFDGYTTDIDWTTGWRLPSAGDDPEWGYNQTDSEFGHLYYESLGNTSDSTPSHGIFENITGSHAYVTGTSWEMPEYGVDGYWYFAFNYMGSHGCLATYESKSGNLRAVAVISGTVSAVPVPGSFLLLGCTLTTLAGLRRKKI